MSDSMLCLTWNRNLANLPDATTATLRISDGGRDREVLLDRDQLANGFLAYRPASDDVIFSLRVRQARTAVLGSVRFLAGRSEPAPSSARPVAFSSVAETQPIVVLRNQRQHRPRDTRERDSLAGAADRSSLRDGLARFVVKTPGVRITIRRADLPHSPERAVTSESLRLPEGRWAFRASAPGCEPESGRFLVNGAGPADIFIRLRPKG